MNVNPLSEEELFDAARSIDDPQARLTYLEANCPDKGLRKRLLSMLSVGNEVDAFFDEGAEALNLGEVSDELRKDPDDEESVGVRIGRYRLIQRLGDGGCGVVYLAEQEEPVRRAVALKIIRLGMESKRVISRFEAERQALAMMDHPNIARVFDAGQTVSGSPYFVMEHVRGDALTNYCRERKLGIIDRLDLFIKVCHAIQHAHQKGIIHGDIKPSNIIISEHDGKAVPRVIDFGIARATEAGFSEMMLFSGPENQVLGSPSYMSPEQVQLGGLDVDTRSDVYSLGVLLYELLTGVTPFDKDRLANVGMADLRNILGKEEPKCPSERLSRLDAEAATEIAESMDKTVPNLVQRLKGDLDSIVMKALSKDRRRRYETADSLATDLNRYLSDEPVAAHPASYVYLMKKTMKRNRVVMLASAAIALTLIFALGVSTVMLLREREARQRAVDAEQLQARLREGAESRERMTQATMLVNNAEFEEADALVRDVVLSEATMEGAAVFRALGEWHAFNENWVLAAERFKVLLEINELEGEDIMSLDYLEIGPVLIELGDLDGYDRFRKDAIERFGDTDIWFADRIVKICLLLPASQKLLAQLEPFANDSREARIEAEADGDTFQASWRSMSNALYEYRSANYTAAVQEAERCLSYPDPNAPRDSAARFILSMAKFKMGKAVEAQEPYELAAGVIKEKFTGGIGKGNPVQGFWFDWAFARVLGYEAARVLGRD